MRSIRANLSHTLGWATDRRARIVYPKPSYSTSHFRKATGRKVIGSSRMPTATIAALCAGIILVFAQPHMSWATSHHDNKPRRFKKTPQKARSGKVSPAVTELMNRTRAFKKDIEEEIPKQQRRQPAKISFTERGADALSVQPLLQRVLNGLSEGTTCLVTDAHLKNNPLAKIPRCAKGETGILDMVRGRITYFTLRDLYEGVRNLQAFHGTGLVQVVRLKDAFQKLRTSHYGDINAALSFELPKQERYHIAEIQMLHAAVEVVKEYYEDHEYRFRENMLADLRALKRNSDIDASWRKKLRQPMTQEIELSNKRSHTLYDPVLQLIKSDQTRAGNERLVKLLFLPIHDYLEPTIRRQLDDIGGRTEQSRLTTFVKARLQQNNIDPHRPYVSLYHTLWQFMASSPSAPKQAPSTDMMSRYLTKANLPAAWSP